MARKCVGGCVGVAFECGGFEVVRQGLCVGKCVWLKNVCGGATTECFSVV